MLSKKFIAGGLAALILTLGAGAAFAAPGRATTSVNVRSGPGTSYRVVDTLYPGERVDIQRCTVGWCYVGKAGLNGWVSEAYLTRTAGPIIVPPPVVVRPPIIIRPPRHHHRPSHHRPPHHRWHHHHRPWVKPPAKAPVCKPFTPGCHIRSHR
jgi:uncharacterized protein YraI